MIVRRDNIDAWDYILVVSGDNFNLLIVYDDYIETT